MKNIEKYKETKDALEAYNSLDFKKVPFDVWLEFDFVEPHAQTLLEAAEAIVNIVAGTPADVTRRLFGELRSAVEREKRKPVRNCDKYRTKKEAYKGFREVCDGMGNCESCLFLDCESVSECAIAYLYAEAKKEAAK